MRMADWLTYTGIEQLQKMHRFYGCTSSNPHSKKDLICSLLQKLNHKQYVQDMLQEITENEYRFLQTLILDPSLAFTMEDLLAKGRSALIIEENPRNLVVRALQRGWIFPGYTVQSKFLYHVPSDFRQKAMQAFRRSFVEDMRGKPPSTYRAEENLLVQDLHHFLQYLRQEVVRLTNEGAIYRNQQKQILGLFYVPEEILLEKGPRFGFGRRYHCYPSRFSLLYDYTFYQGYFLEDPEGYLCLNENKIGNISITQEEAKELYRFWIRLYRRPIPHLPIILRWIGLLAYPDWFPVSSLWKIVSNWFSSYYYETEETLFQKVLRMLLHLGVIQWGEEEGVAFLRLTSSGNKWVNGISAFQIQEMEDEFLMF